MKPPLEVRGWRIHHHEKLIFQANAGTPTLRLKFYQYPPYRQSVEINKFPEKCHLKSKGNNTYFIFHHKVGTKGIISVERIITVLPTPSFINIHEGLGKIADVPRRLQQKYKQRSRYWLLHTSMIQDITAEEWFHIDDISVWIQSVNLYVKRKIKYPENQEKRLGAEQVLRTGIGDCDEFTDLFITIARMRGIPCRRLTGFHIAKSHMVPEAHVWGEILSPLRGWLPIDIALSNLGNHYINYVILKIEEFNPALPDYQIQTKHSTTLHHQWELPTPIFTPIA